MDRELEKYFEEQFNLYSTQGWKDFIEKAQDMYDSYNEVTSIDTAEELFSTKGKLEILEWILGWQRLVEATYKSNQHDSQDF